MEGHDPLVKDAEIRKSMWEGQVPIVFQLNPDEVTSLQPPEPYYISFPPLHHSYLLLLLILLFVIFNTCLILNVVHYLAPRGSYLTAIAGPVRDHFLVSAPAVVDEMWFDHNGIPLKWYHLHLLHLHLHLLLLFISLLLPPRHYPIGVLFDLMGSTLELPWQITVHFQGINPPPTQMLLLLLLLASLLTRSRLWPRVWLVRRRCRLPGADDSAMSHR